MHNIEPPGIALKVPGGSVANDEPVTYSSNMVVKYVVNSARTLGIIRTENPQWLEPLAFLEGGYDPEG